MLDSALFKTLPTKEDAFSDWHKMEAEWATTCEGSREHWIFRGQADERWTFRSTLERTIWSYSELRDNLPPIDEVGLVEYEKILSGRLEDALSKGLPRHFKPRQSEENISTAELELGLIRRFQRHCHQYVQDTPRCNDIVEWLALMRHYGAPTRMLDWTWSFFVALFFALAHSEGTSAVWALNLDAIDKTIPPATQKLFDDDPRVLNPDTTNKMFEQREEGVMAISPLRLNERLVIQQGTFLMPTRVDAPFDKNLAVTLRDAAKPALLKFRISGKQDVRRQFLRRLHRTNVSQATLFPGLDGFARSLEQLFAFPDVIRVSGRLST